MYPNYNYFPQNQQPIVLQNMTSKTSRILSQLQRTETLLSIPTLLTYRSDIPTIRSRLQRKKIIFRSYTPLEPSSMPSQANGFRIGTLRLAQSKRLPITSSSLTSRYLRPIPFAQNTVIQPESTSIAQSATKKPKSIPVLRDITVQSRTGTMVKPVSSRNVRPISQMSSSEKRPLRPIFRQQSIKMVRKRRLRQGNVQHPTNLSLLQPRLVRIAKSQNVSCPRPALTSMSSLLTKAVRNSQRNTISRWLRLS